MKFERLKQLRKKNHVTAQEVADLINLTNVTYRSYEIGTREPKIASLIKMANFFGVSVDYLLNHSDYKYPIDAAKKSLLDMGITDAELQLLTQYRSLGQDMQEFIANSINFAASQQAKNEHDV